MSDIGQDKESLEVKLLEVDYAAAQSKLAKKGIELDEKRIAAKLAQYAKSKQQIDAQLREHEKNATSIREAIRKLEGDRHG